MISEEHVWVDHEDLPSGMMMCSCGTVALFRDSLDMDDWECPLMVTELRIAEALQAAGDSSTRGVYDVPVSQTFQEAADRITGEYHERMVREYEMFHGKGSWEKMSDEERGRLNL